MAISEKTAKRMQQYINAKRELYSKLRTCTKTMNVLAQGMMPQNHTLANSIVVALVRVAQNELAIIRALEKEDTGE